MTQTRRDFLKAAMGTSAFVSLGGLVPPPLASAARAGRDRNTVLVVVQLSGGNDGLNTVVPYADDEYGRHRTTLRFRGRDVLRIDSYLGFHPRMEGFHRLYREGVLGVVQGVGLPGSSRDHGEAMRTWYTAAPVPPDRAAGWLGRLADETWDTRGGDVPVMFVGPIARPAALNGERVYVPAVRSLDDLTRGRAIEEDPRESAGRGDNPLLQHVYRTSRAARAFDRAVREVARDAGHTGDYPGFPLAGDLRTVARLIRAEVGIRVFFTELGGDGFGGFDNHANQRGNHGALLHQLSASVAAFVDDLRRAKLLDRVLLMTFSEFGRTLAENGRRGTGHGAAAPVFLAGGALRGGLTGAHPSLTDLDQGAPRAHTDFRRLYATALESWLGLPSEPVLGRRFAPLDVLRP